MAKRRAVSLVPTLSLAQRMARLLVFLALPVCLAYVGVAWRINEQLKAGWAMAQPAFTVTHGWVWPQLDGRLDGEQFRLAPGAFEAWPGIVAPRFSYETPGWGWLLSRVAAIEPFPWPERLSLRLPAAAVVESATALPSALSPWRLGVLGCPGMLTAALSNQLPALTTPDLRLDLRHHEVTGLTVVTTWEAAGAQRWSGEWHFATTGPMTAEQWRTAVLDNFRVEVIDEGFNVARNQACANATGGEPSAMPEESRLALLAWLTASGAALDAISASAFQAFSEDAGTWQVVGVARRAAGLSNLLADGFLDRSNRYSLQARRNGGPEWTVQFTDTAAKPFAPVSIVPGTSPADVARRDARDASRPPVRVGADADYEQLRGLEGASVEVTTRSGVIRQGQLEQHTDVALYVRIGGQNGFVMNIPADSIQRVRVLRLP